MCRPWQERALSFRELTALISLELGKWECFGRIGAIVRAQKSLLVATVLDGNGPISNCDKNIKHPVLLLVACNDTITVPSNFSAFHTLMPKPKKELLLFLLSQLNQK